MTDSNFVSLPGVSIVVIGHNEGEHLKKVFLAIQGMDYPQDKIQTIFVDSNSIDDSVEIAKEYADNIVSIKSRWPTAGEAFNAGIQRAEHQFIHITAGDIMLTADYLKKAIVTLLNREDICAVTGYFTEENEKGWNKILGYRREEDVVQSDHYVETPNGGTFRKEAFTLVNGYDERIKKGQETEIGYRLNCNNLKIWHINTQQGIHNFDLNSAMDMVRKYFQFGISLGHLLLTSLQKGENKIMKNFAKTAKKRILLLLFYMILVLLSIVFRSIIFIGIAFFMYFILFPTRIFIKHRKETINYRIYFIVNSFFVVFNFLGIISFLIKYSFNRIRGFSYITKRYGLEQEKSLLRKVIDIKQ